MYYWFCILFFSVVYCVDGGSCGFGSRVRFYTRTDRAVLSSTIRDPARGKLSIDSPYVGGSAKMVVLSGLYGRNGAQPSLDFVFEWALKNYLHESIANELLHLFEVMFNVFPSRSKLSSLASFKQPSKGPNNSHHLYEKFILLHEKLMRKVRQEAMNGSFHRQDSINWYNCTIEEWIPEGLGLVYNISADLSKRRYDLVTPLQDIASYNTRDGTSIRYTKDYDNMSALGYLPADNNNPGFDSIFFLRPNVSEHANRKLLAVAGEQKLSSRRSKLFINVYKDILRKQRLAQRALGRTGWASGDVLFVGYYMRKLDPKIANGLRQRSLTESKGSDSIINITNLLKRFQFPSNIIVLDERGMERYLGAPMFELLSILRDSSRLKSKLSNRAAYYTRRLLEHKYRFGKQSSESF